MKRIPAVVLLSGKGSNLHVLAEQAAQGLLPIDIRAVLSDRPEAGGLTRAAEHGIFTESLLPRTFADRASFDLALAAHVEKFAPQLVILAGYMRILSNHFVQQFAGRLLNIHPSLLPKYPGLHTHRRALEARDTAHGASVHFVTEELDGGPVIIQGRVPVLLDDTETSLSARVQRIEHIIYPRAVAWFATGRLTLRQHEVFVDGVKLPEPPIVDLTSND